VFKDAGHLNWDDVDIGSDQAIRSYVSVVTTPNWWAYVLRAYGERLHLFGLIACRGQESRGVLTGRRDGFNEKGLGVRKGNRWMPLSVNKTVGAPS